MGEGHEELKAHIIPEWAPGCRRISPGDGYLEALVKYNVEPVFGGIEKVVPEGLLTADGNLHKVDILVCATGFSVAFKPAFRVINGEGRSVEEDWGSSVKSVFHNSWKVPNRLTCILSLACTWDSLRHAFQIISPLSGLVLRGLTVHFCHRYSFSRASHCVLTSLR